MTAAIELRGVMRAFGAVRAVDDVSFEVAPGEFFSMLGPSGSGKTTCLRLIAGFEVPNAGTVYLGGADVSAVPPYERNVNTVFQDYALFPHMDVLENVGYGLRMRGVAAVERRRRAAQMLALVKLTDFGARRIAQLSGGQRQRVALARALINEPKVLLLDEPLGALDLKLREEMQTELKALQRRLGITFVYVTHDQGEALSMSDRVAVFDRGRIEQLDTPRALYERPKTAFVARFVGSANIVGDALAEQLTGQRGAFAIRPERIAVRRLNAPPSADSAYCEGVVIDLQYHGATSRAQVRLDDGTLLAADQPADRPDGYQPAAGERVRLEWPPAAAVRLAVPA
ncbi:MAG: ABC transporter ATP-binding protein [Steroidobacteraceae bacterium]